MKYILSSSLNTTIQTGQTCIDCISTLTCNCLYSTNYLSLSLKRFLFLPLSFFFSFQWEFPLTIYTWWYIGGFIFSNESFNYSEVIYFIKLSAIYVFGIKIQMCWFSGQTFQEKNVTGRHFIFIARFAKGNNSVLYFNFRLKIEWFSYSKWQNS